MSGKKTLREQFAAIRAREAGKSSRPTTSNEEEQDITESPVAQPEAAKLNPHGRAGKQSGEQMRASLTIARIEQRNNDNELQSIRRRATVSHAQQNRSLFWRLARQTTIPQAEIRTDLAPEIEQLSYKLESQNEILRTLGENTDKHTEDNRVLSRAVDESIAKAKEYQAKVHEQNLLIARLESELATIKAKASALQTSNETCSVDKISKDEKITKLFRLLAESNRQLRESQEARAAAPKSPSPSIDAAHIQSIKIKDSAADKEEITILNSKVSALEEELHAARVQLKELTLKARQMAENHANEMAELTEAKDDLSIEMTCMKQSLISQKEAAEKQLEEMVILVKKLKLELIESKGNFRSWLRIRPPQGTLGKQPISIKGGDSVEVLDRHGTAKTFNFDRVFAPEANNAVVFGDLSEILEAALQGYDITILAYGQTGSGKTYTMSAMLDMAMEQIFTQLAKSYGSDYSVQGRCIEVYEQKVYDLFKPAREQLKVSTDCSGMWPIRDQLLQVHTAPLHSLESVQEMVQEINKNRTSGQTAKNDTSSRSHMFLSFQVKASKTEQSGAITTTRSGITFVDLAGSESLKNVTDRVSETQAINAELSALRSVLTSMGTNQPRIPFRDTQLTRLLQDGFTTGKVLFIQAASLGELEESIHTMDFGGLVSKVTQKKPAKNVITAFAGTEPAAAGEGRTTPTTPTTPTPMKSATGTPSTRGARGGSRGGASGKSTPTPRGGAKKRGV
ncbi:hypothetical protein BELL_0288g00130 [Botrytis elliptica]|uniref:Kinesin motor domain-containing protein n=1 Tax=Botrytis elliptica TaxID=278938 RepID=A0A4Z1JM21_9HELO|nr:hypothetical protein EAE99_007901 [Botrytis elliptica]TGO74374.1 hypothetical protein BELL_0288g00130 [Botrytis elliptica]